MSTEAFLDLNTRFVIIGFLMVIAVTLMFIAFGKDSHKAHKHKKE